jgi:hypothetical protein
MEIINQAAIESLRTVAGSVDPAAWAEIEKQIGEHGISSLSGAAAYVVRDLVTKHGSHNQASHGRGRGSGGGGKAPAKTESGGDGGKVTVRQMQGAADFLDNYGDVGSEQFAPSGIGNMGASQAKRMVDHAKKLGWKDDTEPGGGGGGAPAKPSSDGGGGKSARFAAEQMSAPAKAPAPAKAAAPTKEPSSVKRTEQAKKLVADGEVTPREVLAGGMRSVSVDHPDLPKGSRGVLLARSGDSYPNAFNTVGFSKPVKIDGETTDIYTFDDKMVTIRDNERESA